MAAPRRARTPRQRARHYLVSTDPLSLARSWANDLPRDFARHLAEALKDGPSAVRALRSATALPASTASLRQALELAEAGDGPFTSGALSALLDALGEQPTITPVWTGPQSSRPVGRLTIAVLADLIGEADEEILLVSYATVPSVDLRSALASAIDRGVRVTTLLERPADNPQFASHGEPFPGLSAECLSWPAAERPPGAAMHAKVLVVDRRTALVGSANLTGYGLERNLECGLLIRGGEIPADLVEHLLTTRGICRRGPPTGSGSSPGAA